MFHKVMIGVGLFFSVAPLWGIVGGAKLEDAYALLGAGIIFALLAIATRPGT